MAGQLGLSDISGWTFGRLLAACKEKRNEQWSHTCAIMAMIYNCNRGKDTPAIHPGDLHPDYEYGAMMSRGAFASWHDAARTRQEAEAKERKSNGRRS
jgi:hypothetical protein